MKWLPNKKAGYRIRQKKQFAPAIASLTSQTKILMLCLVGTGVFLWGNAVKLRFDTNSSPSPQKLSHDLDRLAAEISVKILDRNFLGSGFLIRQTGNKYFVVTNQHVLRAGQAPYKIEAPDGRVYRAKVVPNLVATDYQYDLAVLSFEADPIYSTARIGSSLFLEVGEPIFAAGFPQQESSERSPGAKSSELALKSGRVAIILDRALTEGYQIGYTNDVKRGMSGGPVLNSRGEVIAINGKHAYPLWEEPEVYQDGSEPCPALQELITRNSLAIPIEKSIELTPQLQSLKALFNPDTASNQEFKNLKVVAKMQAKAKATHQSCQNYARTVDRLNE